MAIGATPPAIWKTPKPPAHNHARQKPTGPPRGIREPAIGASSPVIWKIGLFVTRNQRWDAEDEA